MRRSRSLWLGIMIVIVLALAMTACAPAPKREAGVSLPQAVPPVAATVVVEKAVVQEGAADLSAYQVGSLTERMIIRTGNLTLVVKDTAGAMNQVRGLVESMGGYVVESNAYRDQGLLRGRMTVRVPAEKFDQAMDGIRAVAVRVESESSSGQDVTEEYSDLSAQLRNLEATETELRELLATVRERTGKAEDILAVYRELTTIRGEIERVKGRMQYLERMTALATINVELIPDELQKPVVEEPWNPQVTLKEALRALVNAGRFLVDALIWLVVVVLPILIIIALPVVALVLIIRALGRRRRKSAE